MTEAGVSGMSAILAVGAQATPASQPTVEQAARFQTLVQQADPPGLQLASYGQPLAPPITLDSQLQPLTDYAADISEQMRQYLQPPPLDIDAELWPELHSLQQLAQQTHAINVASVQLQLFGKGVQLINDSVQALYQRV